MSYSRALVTGGAGFIGSHLADALLGEGLDVVVLDNLSVGKRENVPQDAKLIVGDIRNPEDLTESASARRLRTSTTPPITTSWVR